MTKLDERNIISIVEIAFYTPFLAIAFFLGSRLGFGRSQGWFFLITFSLLRLIGAGLQLGELASPTNVSLYIGAAICQNIGFSPLLLTTLALLVRVWDSIRKHKPSKKIIFVDYTIQALIIIALILGIVGGVVAGNNFVKTQKFTYVAESKISVVLFIISFVTLVLMLIYTSFKMEFVDAGEKRLLLTIWVSMPFLTARLVYSCLSNFSTKPDFNVLTGNATILLALAIIEEIIVVILYETCGLTLKPRVKNITSETNGNNNNNNNNNSGYQEPQYQQRMPQQQKERSAGRKFAHFFATYTIFGNILAPIIRKMGSGGKGKGDAPLSQVELTGGRA